MIREIASTQLDVIDPLIVHFREHSEKGTVPDNFGAQIKDAVSKDTACLYGDFAEDESLRGIGIFGKVSNRISFVYAEGNLEIEKKLASVLFNRFSIERSSITTSGTWIGDGLSNYIVELGFMKRDRAHMTLTRTEIEKLPPPFLPTNMLFEAYSESNRDEISQLIFKSNDGTVDQEIFPDFFSTPENCWRLLESIEANRYGDYKEFSSWILRQDDIAIGACFMTIRSGDTGYIPDIVIEPGFRGNGLGKAILVHSMKRQVESEPTLAKINLDVTLSNNARYLYESLGFKTVQNHVMYTWKK